MNDYMNLGRVVPLHRGDYDAAQTYELNDIVNYQGAGYWHRGQTATTGVAPTDGTVWVRIINGVPGPTGDPATLVDNDVAYQAGDSGTVVPTGEWSGDVPNVAQGEYLWVRTTVNFNSGEPVVCYGVSRMGVDGSGSVISVNGISPDDSGDVKFTGAKGKYLGFTAENTLGAVDLPSASTTASVTLTAAGWSSGTQTVSVAGLAASDSVIVAPAPASRDAYINSDVRCTAQGEAQLTFTAASTPTVDVTVNVIVLKR